MYFQTGKFILILFFLFGCSCGQKNSEKDKMEVTIGPKTASYLLAIESGIQGEFQLAKEQLETTLKQNPSHISAKDKLRVILDVLENKISKETAIGIFKGIKYSLSQNTQEALNEFSKAIENQPEYDELYRLRGRAYVDLRDYSKALQNFNLALNLNPGNTTAILNRANTYMYIGKLDSSLLDLNRAIDLLPGEASAFLNRGSLYAKINRYDKAIQDFNKAIELDSGFAIAYFNKGLVCELAGKETEALKSFKKFVSIAKSEDKKAIDYSKARIQKIESRSR